jgi:hypothetical protein
VGSEDRGVGRGNDLGDGLPWSMAAALLTVWWCVPLRGTGGGHLNRRQGMGRGPRPPPCRLPRPLLRRYGAGLGRRACPGRGRGRTGGFKPCDRATSVGATRGGDGLQCALERDPSGPRGSRRRGRQATCRGAGAPERQGTDPTINSLVNAGLTWFFVKNLN